MSGSHPPWPPPSPPHQGPTLVLALSGRGVCGNKRCVEALGNGSSERHRDYGPRAGRRCWARVENAPYSGGRQPPSRLLTPGDGRNQPKPRWTDALEALCVPQHTVGSGLHRESQMLRSCCHAVRDFPAFQGTWQHCPLWDWPWLWGSRLPRGGLPHPSLPGSFPAGAALWPRSQALQDTALQLSSPGSSREAGLSSSCDR